MSNYNRNWGYSPNDGYRDNGGRDRRAPYNPNYRRNDAPKKKSGAKMGQCVVKSTGESKPYISGWMVRNRRMYKAICGPCNEYKTKSPNSEKWLVKYSVDMEMPQLVTGFYNTLTRKLTIPDLSIVLNPSAPNGGYMGSFITSKRR